MENDPIRHGDYTSPSPDAESRVSTEETSHGMKRKRGRPRKSRFFERPRENNPEEGEELPNTDFDAHHQISDSRQVWIDVTRLMTEHREDPAAKVRVYLRVSQ